MRPTLPKITVRRMMALVLLVSFILGGEVQRRRWVVWSEHCREKARFHAAKAEGARGICIDSFMVPPFFPTDEVSAQYHDRMEQKWEQAARRPWFSVQVDVETSESADRSNIGWTRCRCHWCQEWVKAGAPMAF